MRKQQNLLSWLVIYKNKAKQLPYRCINPISYIMRININLNYHLSYQLCTILGISEFKVTEPLSDLLQQPTVRTVYMNWIHILYTVVYLSHCKYHIHHLGGLVVLKIKLSVTKIKLKLKIPVVNDNTILC